MPYKLLLADDSVTIQRVIELTFADEDVQVAVVGDGEQAIDRIKAEPPDIVLADIGMPLRDGYEVTEFVKKSPALSHIPVILLRGAFEAIDEARAQSVGCDGVLVKPFEPQMVINRVKELLVAPRPAVAPETPAAPPHPPEIDEDTGAPASRQEGAGDSLDHYFDRLDAAFAALASNRPKPALTMDAPAGGGDAAPPGASTSASDDAAVTAWDPDVTGNLAPRAQPHLASAFAAMLAAEEGHPARRHSTSLSLPDEAIEEIVRRVLARMEGDAIRRLVIETAERVVREEIDRIKRG